MSPGIKRIDITPKIEIGGQIEPVKIRLRSKLGGNRRTDDDADADADDETDAKKVYFDTSNTSDTSAALI